MRDGQYYYSPAFVVNCLDTTGAGDVFHGAFCYAVLQGMRMPDVLEFSNAMAALNCTALGARGGIRGLDDVRAMMARAERRSHPDFASRAVAAHVNDSDQSHAAELFQAGRDHPADLHQSAGLSERILAGAGRSVFAQLIS